MSGASKTTTNHDEIRKWAEARQGKPATVKRTEANDEPGVLRINFPGYSGEQSLEEITWEEFFQKFDEKKLAFLYQDETSSGEQSRFFKLVSRETAEHAHTSHKSDSGSQHKTESKAGHKSDEKAHKAEYKSETKAKAEHKSEHKAETKAKDEKAHKSEHKSDEKEHKSEHKAEKAKATSKSHKS